MKSKIIGNGLPELFATVKKRRSSSNEARGDVGATALQPSTTDPSVGVSGAAVTKSQLEALVVRLQKDLLESDAQRLAAEDRLKQSARRVADMRAELDRLRPVQQRIAEVNGRLAHLEEVVQEQARIIWVKDKMIEELMKPDSKRRRSRLLMATRKLS